MLKTILSLEGVAVLNKNQQKEVHGGNNLRVPSEAINAKCCWDNHPNSCSECVMTDYPSCTSGAHIVAC